MERIFKSTSEELYKKIRVVIGIQEIREYTVVSETVYEAISPNMPINHLILSIHIAQVQFEDKDDTLVYYKNCYGHNIAVINDSIINLLTMEENLCLMPDGAIILWSKHSIFSTVDMQQLDFHLELNDFLKEYSVLMISERYITLQNNISQEMSARKIRTKVNLLGKYPVKILISNEEETS